MTPAKDQRPESAVERFSAWNYRIRRLAKDIGATVAPAEAFLYAAPARALKDGL